VVLAERQLYLRLADYCHIGHQLHTQIACLNFQHATLAIHLGLAFAVHICLTAAAVRAFNPGLPLQPSQTPHRRQARAQAARRDDTRGAMIIASAIILAILTTLLLLTSP
jgi:hypothetical protein